MSPEELAEIEARLKAAQGDDGTLALTADEYGHVWYADGDACVYVRGNLGLGINGSELARLLAHAPSDIARLLAEVRRLTPAPKVARWGKVKSHPGFDVLRVGRKVWASVDCLNGLWRACITQQPSTFYTKESEARAHIEAWACGKGWEVRNA